MRRIAAKFVPRLLNSEQRDHRVQVCTELVVREFLTKNNMTTAPHPAYSPDLAPCDFYMLPKMKLPLNGRRFVSIEEIQAESQQVLNTLTPADYFQKWQNHWDRCIQAQGNYFEGYGGN
jgi:hypothetical protein